MKQKVYDFKPTKVEIKDNIVIKRFQAEGEELQQNGWKKDDLVKRSPIWSEIKLTYEMSGKKFMPQIHAHTMNINKKEVLLRTQYFEHISFQSFLGRRLPFKELQFVLFQIFLAIAQLLRYGIVHYDLHANNILIESCPMPVINHLKFHYNGTDFYTPNLALQVRIIDFGFAYKPGKFKHPHLSKMTAVNRPVAPEYIDICRVVDSLHYYNQTDMYQYMIPHIERALHEKTKLVDIMRICFIQYLDPLEDAYSYFNLPKKN